jgi:pyridoxine 5-phosphate synthase
MTKLSVNVNKIATLRNARGGALPDLAGLSRQIENFGADGITVHPRPDERHIRYEDVRILAAQNTTEFNVEGYPSKDFLLLVEEVRPTQVTLVPDPPEVLTSNAGWTVSNNLEFLKEVIRQLKSHDARVSLFMDCDRGEIELAKEVGADRIELYTESYAANYHQDRSAAVADYVKASHWASDIGLGLNAGHDLDLKNLRFFAQSVKDLLEVSIGHALISDALIYGLSNVVPMYKYELRP